MLIFLKKKNSNPFKNGKILFFYFFIEKRYEWRETTVSYNSFSFVIYVSWFGPLYRNLSCYLFYGIQHTSLGLPLWLIHWSSQDIVSLDIFDHFSTSQIQAKKFSTWTQIFFGEKYKGQKLHHILSSNTPRILFWWRT